MVKKKWTRFLVLFKYLPTTSIFYINIKQFTQQRIINVQTAQTSFIISVILYVFTVKTFITNFKYYTNFLISN